MAVKFFISTKNRGTETSPVAESHIVLNGDGTKTLFLIHGLTGTPHEMRYLANFFHKKKSYTVICPRLANHGEPLTVLKKTTWQEFYKSVRDAFVAVRKTTPGPIFVSGLSMGALLSLLLAVEFPNEVSGVSCLSPTLFYDGWNVPWYSSFLLPLLCKPPFKYFSYFKEEPPYGIKNKALQKKVHKYYTTASIHDIEGAAEYGYPYFPIALLHQLKLLVKYLVRLFPSVSVPVQLIQANEDDMTSVKNSTFIYDRVNSDVKEMVLLHNSYHVITADQERDTVARKMDDFFKHVIETADIKQETVKDEKK